MLRRMITIAAILGIIFSTSVCIAEQLPSLNETMKNVSLKDQKVEIQNEFDSYSPDNLDEISDFGDFKIIILQRSAPDKEFTEKKYDYFMINEAKGFDDDFKGVDLETKRVWYRGDLMSQIPSSFRAASLDDADLLVVAEHEYVLGGSISVIDYLDNQDEDMPDFDTVEEMEQYLLAHQKVPSSITYYPKFAVISWLNLYRVNSKERSSYNLEFKTPRRFARNPEASDQWSNMTDLLAIIELLNAEAVDYSNVKDKIALLDDIPQPKKDLWLSCLDSGEYTTTSFSIQEYFWQMAEQLKGMDPSAENREKYNLIIDEKDFNALKLFVSYCDYSGFNQSVESIRLSKEYMATPDDQTLENLLKEFINYMNGSDT